LEVTGLGFFGYDYFSSFIVFFFTLSATTGKKELNGEKNLPFPRLIILRREGVSEYKEKVSSFRSSPNCPPPPIIRLVFSFHGGISRCRSRGKVTAIRERVEGINMQVGSSSAL
jgi:hypothetical protein